MPRTSLYNLNDILCEAEDIFIEHSYNGAVMDEIIARTEFNRRGFYLEFGSKLKFLYAALEYYDTHKLSPILAHLEDHQGLASIERFFATYIEHIYGRGCLLINMVTELGSEDDHIR